MFADVFKFNYRLTLFGRSLLLFTLEILANAILWTVAGILFGRTRDTRPVLGLSLLAWTLGLRHGMLETMHLYQPLELKHHPMQLSMQTISGDDTQRPFPSRAHPKFPVAIDNATRGLINLGQLPVTCGLFFSLGHSTIVIIVTVAIAISSDVFNKIHNVGTVGGIIGASVSGAFLFIVGLANTIILWRILQRRSRVKKRERAIANGEVVLEEEETRDSKHDGMLMMRILGPIITFVNRPWKMYPVGVLFGLGFDTASSIALLAVSALAKKGASGGSIPSSHIIILPLLFTTGMTLLDSTDSILMLYSYSGFPGSWTLFEKRRATLPLTSQPGETSEKPRIPELPQDSEKEKIPDDIARVSSRAAVESNHSQTAEEIEERIERDTRVKMNVMSGLSIILTLMSILVAFSISLITIMGVIGENCARCLTAAEAEDGGGLAGSWWRGWANANEQSGYVGIGIVGGFLIIVSGWYGARWAMRKVRERRGRGV